MDGRFNGTMHNVVGLTLVAMATKFGLGAESSRLPACLLQCQSVLGGHTLGTTAKIILILSTHPQTRIGVNAA